MPKAIDPGIFAPLGGKFDSYLPASGVVNGQIAPQFAAIARVDFGRMSLENGSQLCSRLAKGVAESAGWPESNLPALVELVGRSVATFPTDAVAELLDAAAAGVKLIPDALQALDEAASEAVTNIPILGWVAKLALGIWRLVEAVREKPPETTSVRALVYDRDADSDLCRAMLSDMAAIDWSRIFMPPSPGISNAKIAYSVLGIADGYAWGSLSAATPYGANLEQPTRGAAPGVSAWAGYWQSPRKLLDSTRDAGLESIVGFDDLAPASTQLAGLAWMYLQRPGPRMCALEHAAVRDAWKEYGDAMRSAIKAAGGEDEWLGRQMRRSWRYWAPGQYEADPYNPHPGTDLDVVVAKKLENLLARTRKLLNTYAVAYVPKDAPALKDPALRKQWADNRIRLLSHDAVHDVDASLIPDPEYRSALVAAQKSASGSITWMPAPHRTPPTIDGGPQPPNPDPPDLPPARRRPEGGEQPTDASAVGIGLGIAAAAYLLLA